MDDEATGGSEVCFLHNLVAGQPVDPDTARDVARFRRAERVRLIAARRALSGADRALMTERLTAALTGLVAPKPRLTVAAYWPIRGEPDLRGWMADLAAAGASVLLPVVVEKNAPIEFRRWTPGCRMERGIWNIPVPAEGPAERPDVVVSPLVGVDTACYRLGNGGGYYDRTLAALSPLPLVIGVGFDFCKMPTIFPMPWDIPMQIVALGDGSVAHRSG
jgi:5,10-methenyltetrahydrofolate synthetase